MVFWYANGTVKSAETLILRILQRQQKAVNKVVLLLLTNSAAFAFYRAWYHYTELKKISTKKLSKKGDAIKSYTNDEFRGRSRAAATSKMECFVLIVNG